MSGSKEEGHSSPRTILLDTTATPRSLPSIRYTNYVTGGNTTKMVKLGQVVETDGQRR